MELAVLVRPGVATREALAPTEVLSSVLGATPTYLGTDERRVTGHDPVHNFDIDACYAVHRPDVLVVPGGFGSLTSAHDADLIGWLRAIIASRCAVLTISTGSLSVCATGLLAGRPVAAHWLCAPHVRALGCIPSPYPMETHDRIVTTSGTAASLGGAAFIADLARFGPA